jgi:hypothetical protein
VWAKYGTLEFKLKEIIEVFEMICKKHNAVWLGEYCPMCVDARRKQEGV